MDEGELSEIIGGIYDAALDPTLWPDALESVVTLWGGEAGCLIASDPGPCDHRVICQMGLPHLGARTDIDGYLGCPELDGVLSLSQGGIIRVSDTLPPDKFQRTLLYRDWMAPHGWTDLLFIPIRNPDGRAFILAVLYRQINTAQCFDIARLILPHLGHALAIHGALQQTQTQVASFEATLDSLRPSVFLLNRDGSLAQANASASAMLRQGKILYSMTGELRFRDEEANRQVKSAINSASKGFFDEISTAIPIVSPDGERYLARLLSLQTQMKTSEGGHLTAALALFVYKAELETTSPLRVIAEAYNLTPAEMRVFLAVVQIGGVPEAAEVLGITKNTIRVLLQRVYNKTGLNRQAELAKLLASFSTPLAE